MNDCTKFGALVHSVTIYHIFGHKQPSLITTKVASRQNAWQCGIISSTFHFLTFH